MNRQLELVVGLVSLTVAVSCGFGPLDILGEEAAVTELAKTASVPEDDRIADKHPEYDPDRMVQETFSPLCEITLNKSATVTRLDIVPLEGQDADLADRVFPNRASAIAELDRRTNDEITLIPSMEVVNGALKPFNDGLYAAIELGAQEGLQDEEQVVYPSKQLFIQELLAAALGLRETAGGSGAAGLDAAIIDLAAALLLAGEQPELPSDLLPQAQAAAEDFESQPLYSRPIGFYTWNASLEQVFRQDRFLQNYQVDYPEPSDPYSELELRKAAALALAIGTDPELEARYQGYLALYRGLTNPFVNYPVTDLLPYLSGIDSLQDPAALRSAFIADHPVTTDSFACQPHFALFPASRSKEVTYFESRYCDYPAPPDLNYLDELIRAIREGLIDLAPADDSGWYDYQSWALETLLLPERASESEHLLLTRTYKEKLRETFKTITIQNRETHVKQLEMGASSCGAAPMQADLYPLFPVEPFPTFYLRSARAYRFLSVYLASVLSADFMKSTHRLFEDNTLAEANLQEELRQKAELLYGLHMLSAEAVGSEPELLPEELDEFGEEACRARAATWAQEWRDDSDLLRDPRVIVPVSRDLDAEQTVYWATLGVKAVKARAEFVKGYEPRDISGCWTGEIVPHDYWLMAEVSAEIRRPLLAAPPTRAELREICDRYQSLPEMITALENL